MAWLVVAVIAALLNNACAQPMLTLDDALKISLENNYSIKLWRNEAEIAKNSNSAGMAGMLPYATGAAVQDNSVNDTKQRFLTGAENNRNNAKSSVLSAGVEVGWTVFDGFKMFAAKNRLQELQDLGDLRLRSQIEATFTRVIRSYYEVAQAKQLLNVTTETVKLSEGRLKLVQDRFDAGKAAKTEILRAQVDLNTDKASVIRQANQLKNAKVAFNQMLGRNLNVEFDVPTSAEANTGLKLEELQGKAQSQNTAVLIAKKNQRVAHFIIREIRGERMPTLDLRTGYNYNKQESQAGFLQSSQVNGYHYGVALSVNLFDGFTVSKRVQNARLATRSLDLVLQDTLTRVEMSLQQSYNSYLMLVQLFSLEKENIEVAKSNFELANEQFRIGVITSLELREAQQNLLLSESRLSTAGYETKLAETDLLRISGQLLQMK